jgi:glycosyltransferase involved in cell wall biosynthesis
MKVLLVGNYGPDRQQSMQRYAGLLRDLLGSEDVQMQILTPQPVFSRLPFAPAALRKWLGYIDKYLIFPPLLRLRAPAFDLVHICDHSNAMYRPWTGRTPCLVTCHDMLAIRGGLGDSSVKTYPSLFGRLLQRWILTALASSPAIAFVSRSTLNDFLRLTNRTRDEVGFTLRVILNPLNAPFTATVDCEILRSTVPELLQTPYLLMVGSSDPRKNRQAGIRLLHRLGSRWRGKLVIAGQKISTPEGGLAADLGVTGRILQVIDPDHALLNALYVQAQALLFPSHSEGFGWPVIEAQQCGCPLICSTATSLPEVAGAGAIFCDPSDLEAMASAVLRLEDPADRAALLAAGRANLTRFDSEVIRDQYLDFYRTVSSPPPCKRRHSCSEA